MKKVYISAQHMHPLVRAAIITNNISNLDILLINGKDLNIPDKNGVSALMHAAEHNYIELCTYLLNHGADTSYKAPDGKDVFAYAHDDEIIRILKDSLEDIEDPFLAIKWIPEPDFVAKSQNDNDIQELLEFQNSLSESEIFNNDTEWDSSWIDIPFLLEQKKEFLVTEQLTAALTNLYWEQRICKQELDFLFIENDSFSIDSLLIALSCCGIEISEDPSFLINTTINDEVEDFHYEILSIVAEEESQVDDPFYRMYSNYAKQKKIQFHNETILFAEINKIYQEIVDLILTSQKVLITLFKLFLFRDSDIFKTEITKALGCMLHIQEPISVDGLTIEEEVDNYNEIQDFQSEDEEITDDPSFHSKFSVGRVLFEGVEVNCNQIQKLLFRVELSPVIDSFLQHEISDIITKLNPSVFCFERICHELSSRNLENLVVNKLSMKLQEIQKLRYEIALMNYGLVFFVLKQYPVPDIPREDSSQEGFLGLVRAVEKFDVEAGTKFSTYAVIWIKQSIWRYRDFNYSTIRYPVHFTNLYSKYQKILQEYDERGEIISSVSEIAGLLEIAETTAEGLMHNYHELLSFEEIVEASPIFGTGPPDCHFEEVTCWNLDYETKNLIRIFSEALDNNQNIFTQELQSILIKVLSELKPRLKEVIEKRFGLFGYEAMTLEKTSEGYGITRERVRQIEKKALKQLGIKYKYIEIMRSYLGYEVFV